MAETAAEMKDYTKRTDQPTCAIPNKHMDATKAGNLCVALVLAVAVGLHILGVIP